VPTPTATATAEPTETATPTPVGSTCNLEPGPVTRYAIAPRADYFLTGSGAIEAPSMFVRVIDPFKDEVLCVDKDEPHRLEFNSNQRNAQNEECCWEEDPQWEVVTDPDGIVGAAGPWGANGFQFRMRVDPNGQKTSVTLRATIDGGLPSYPWQSNSFYPKETPLKIVFMSQAEIATKCQCQYFGNGIYADNGSLNCPK
jgi:hypothetical protein